MKKLFKLVKKISSAFATIALFTGIAVSNSACFIVYHQPKEPAAMEKFKF